MWALERDKDLVRAYLFRPLPMEVIANSSEETPRGWDDPFVASLAFCDEIRRSPTQMSLSRRPRTLQRRKPTSTMAVAIARSQWVPSAEMSLSASAGASTLGWVCGTLTRGTVGTFRPPSRRVASPRGTGLASSPVSLRATS